MSYQRIAKLRKLVRILNELDAEQAGFDSHDPRVAEDVRQTRVFLEKAVMGLENKS